MQSSGSLVRWLFLGLVMLCAPLHAAGPGLVLLTNLAAARGVAPEVTESNLPPFRLEGVVTFTDNPWRMWFIQEGETGMYMWGDPPLTRIQAGQRLRIEGTVQPGGYSPILLVTNHTDLGEAATWPAARQPEQDRLRNGQEDSQWLELRGIVQRVDRVDGHPRLVLVGTFGRLDVFFPAQLTGTPPPDWVGAAVRVRGVCSTVFNARSQLLDVQLNTPRWQDVTVETPAVADPFALPLKPLPRLLTFDPEVTANRQVRVQGTVTLQHSDGHFYLQAGTNGLPVTLLDPVLLPPGAVVTAVGFVRPAGSGPVLEHAMVRVLTNGASPRPVRIQPDQAEKLAGAVLVEVEGRFNASLRRGGEEIAVLTGDQGVVFEASLPRATNTPARFASMRRDSRLRLTGVLEPYAATPGSTLRFKVWLRGPADLVMAAAGPWWNARRAFTLAGALAALGVGTVAWNLMLRRKVASQTRSFQAQLEKERALEQRYRDLTENAVDLIFSVDLAGRIRTANAAALRAMGVTAAEATQAQLGEFIAPHHRAMVAERMENVRATGAVDQQSLVVDALSRRREHFTFEITSRLVQRPGETPELEIVARDITARRRAEEQRDGQQRVLELIARGRPLEAVLADLVRNLEQQRPGLLCSILLLEPDGITLRTGAAPSLPDDYNRAVDGLRSGEGAGSCGTAVARREAVIAEDITTDPLWSEEFRGLAARHGLRSCWSFPVFSTASKLLGTFACYRSAPGAPAPEDLQLIDQASSLVSVALERHAADAALRYSEERLRACIEHTPNVAIQWYDAAGRVRFWNQASERIFGWPAEAAQGKTLDELIFTPEQTAIFLAQLGQVAADSRVTGPEEFPFRRRDGQPGTCLSTLFRLPSLDGEPLFVCMDVDITANQQAEAELVRAKEAAEAANRAKSDFLAVMSHEIRTPLNGVIGFTDLLLDGTLPPGQHRFAETIKQSGEALLAVINDILDFSKIEAGHLELQHEPFRLEDTVAEVAELMSVRAEEKGIELVLDFAPDVPEEVVGDPARVRQVLMNLVGNAVKFTAQGQVTVEVGRSDGSLRLAVTDSGPGIAADKQPLLFQRFTQLGSPATRQHGGTGLGLAISKQLVTLMGGAIGLESVPEVGSTFWFTLPVAGGPASAPNPPLPDLEGLRVLLVNMPEPVRRVLARQLKVWGCEPQAAERTAAQEQLTAAAQAGRPWDLVFVDLAATDARLARFVREVRAGGAWPAPALVALHRRTTPAGFFQDSCDATLARPVAAPGPVLRAVRAALTRHGRLPRPAAAEAGGPAVVPDGPVPGSGPEILLAEDDSTSALYATYLLERLGYRTRTARNGREAVALARSQPFRVILMDCLMPELDGLSAARELRREPGASGGVPIIALTAGTPAGDREACLAAGMDDYLEKPIRAERLQAMLTRWLPAEPAKRKQDST